MFIEQARVFVSLSKCVSYFSACQVTHTCARCCTGPPQCETILRRHSRITVTPTVYMDMTDT